MPRSTNPANYETVYWDLLEAMKEDIGEINVSMNASAAQKAKFSFYAFIYALEAQGNKFAKNKDPVSAAKLQSDANTMRGYLVSIDIDGIACSRVEVGDKRPAILRFINRDLNPETKSFREQVQAQLRRAESTSSTPELEEPAIKVPSVDAFFDKPLEIKDDG